MVFDKLIKIQKQDVETEKWSDFLSLHASVNKTKQSEYLNAGASQSKRTLTFTVRYVKSLEDISYNSQLYRIVFNDKKFNIIDFDDYMMTHKEVKFIGESYE